MNPQVWAELSTELQKKQILHDTSEDKIRRAKNIAGHFNINEASKYVADHDQLQTDRKWNSIWDIRLWPKISIFLWLVLHRQILTWENIWKKGFIGPSRCQLYE